MRQKLDLVFSPGQNCGFTPVGMATFADLRPAAVVRELVQNSLDAAREVGKRPAVVRFRTTMVPTNDLPGIRSYRSAFESAVRHQEKLNGGSLPAQAQIVVDTIDHALARDEQTVMFVSDNGIGMNKSRMNALLGDGISIQGSSSSTGSYGNGHSVPIPASDLRYVLYGGVVESGRRIVSGHAVLASHKIGGGALSSGHGLLTMSAKKAVIGGNYRFASGKDIPSFVEREIKAIRQEYGHGSVVALPAFNNFREPKGSLWPTVVARAVACNFLAAVHDGDLVVTAQEDCDPGPSETMVVDADTLADVLEGCREQRRTRSFLSGSRAFDAHRVLIEADTHEVATAQGLATVRLRLDVVGPGRVDLCRNGMWITHWLPGFQGHFTGRRPFHALVLVDSGTGGALHDLLRKAEGPLHDNLAMKSVGPNDRKALRGALEEIREFLKGEVPEVGSESFRPDDFLTLDFGEEGGDGGGGGKGAPSFWGTPMPVEGLALPGWQRDFEEGGSGINRVPTEGGGKGTGRTRVATETKRRRPALRRFFRAVAVPVSPMRRRLVVQCMEACDDAEIRLVIDENLDATCEPRRGDNPPVGLTSVTVEGREVERDRLVTESGRTVGVRLGDLGAGSTHRLEVEYSLPDGLEGLDREAVAFRVEMHPSVRVSAGGGRE